MGHHHHGAAVRSQPVLQPRRSAGVQVVGGFVQEQDVRRIGQDTGQRHTFLFTAGERAQEPVSVQAAQAQPVQRRLHPGFRRVAFAQLVFGLQPAVGLQLFVLGVGQACLQPVQLGLERPQRRQGRVDGGTHGEGFRQAVGLGKVAHPAVAARGAFVGSLEAGQDPEQRGFAGAVLTDDCHVLTRGDDQADAVKQEPVAVAMGDARKVEVFSQEKSL